MKGHGLSYLLGSIPHTLHNARQGRLARLIGTPHLIFMTSDKERERHALECQDRIETMSDDEVRHAYLTTDGKPGDQWIDLLAAALEARDIKL